jgi:hypothetical protein
MFFVSCTSYRYLKVESGNTALSTGKEFVAETDTARITYRFSGLRLPATVTVYNRSSRGLEVDWTRSAVIVDDHSFAFQDGQVPVRGSLSGTIMPGMGTQTSLDGTVAATATLPPGVQFLPPRSSVVRHGPPVIDPARPRQELNLGAGKDHSWSELSETFPFRVYLTMRFVDDPVHSFSVERDFRVVELMKTTREPGVLFGKNIPGNVGYISRHNLAPGILGLIGIIVVGVVAF